MARPTADERTGTASHDTPEDTHSAEQGNGHVSPWEWLVAAIGLALVASTISFMLYQAIADGDAPPLVELQIATIQPAGTGYLVTFTATNSGDITAADLTIEGELHEDTNITETATATITYLPAGSSREGGLYFTQDPHRYRLELHAKGYEQP